MHVVQSYSFEILLPLQRAALQRGYQVAWFVAPALRQNLQASERSLTTLEGIKDWNPDAVFVPGNEVPSSFPGIKVQVFHGFGIEKKGHFRIRGMFDLYCTHGELTTSVFNGLALKHGNFLVKETGWPKVDPLFKTGTIDKTSSERLKVLYAPTFSPKLTSAADLLPEVGRLLGKHDWEWRVKFHPKMDSELASRWRELDGANYDVVTGDILPQLKWADVLVTDTSSVAAEFMLLDKPVISYKNRAPGNHLINITSSEELEAELRVVHAGEIKNQLQRREYAQAMHPYADGLSSERVLDAVQEVIFSGQLEQLKPLPKLWLRQRKMKKALNL